ncbi:hypothetical protein B0T16DRAFT_387313 [Cercophora newfieldiana]|uniref:Zn(2)-C6 fungal-type domain-containing protein n=1 Tax=Cercophora newfieldiana TaxID=92897 RepID=A0AA39YGI3_9PEZI|nr:hypothetical protein B0T16DRAFT_387313 [Cercophora newfieldiana]
MAEQLKRTFHGCLTCRKRKVRCHGGNPCQNCSRMNITCHSSFDTNLRIRVSTPHGQKVVDTKPVPKREPVEPLKQQPPPPPQQQRAIPNSAYLGYGVRSDPYVASFQPQFSSFAFAQPTTSYAPEPSTLQLAPPSSLALGGTIPSMDPGQFSGVWTPFDFSAIDPDLSREFLPRVDVGMPTPPLNLPPVFDSSFLPSTPGSQPYSISDSEGSTSSRGHGGGPAREAPKEWIPRRRKRTFRKDEAAAVMPSTPARITPDESELYTHLHSSAAAQDDFIHEQDARWSLNSTELSASGVVDPRYAQADEQVEKLLLLPDATRDLGNAFYPVRNVAEMAMATAFFLNRYDVLGGDLKSAAARLERMTAWLARHTEALELSGIFSSDYLRFPTLLDVLTGREDYHGILERSHGFYADMFGTSYPSERLEEDVERIPAALHLHETFRLLTSILRYRALRRQQSLTGGEDHTAWEELAAVKRTVEDEIARVEADFELAVAINPSAEVLKHGPMPGMSASSAAAYGAGAGAVLGPRAPPTPPYSGKLSRVSLHWLTAYAAFMTTKILWSRLIRLDVRTDETSSRAVEGILQIALILRRSEGEKLHARELPSMLWPLPLFVAGIEAVDEVWADWVKMFIKGVEGGKGSGAEKGASAKIVELMDDIRRQQNEVGGRVVVTDILAERGEGTEMFVF